MNFGIEKMLHWQLDHPLHMFLILLDTTIYKCEMFPQCRQSLGYCPQFDALDPLLTGREHLRRVYYLIYNQTIMLLTPALCRLYARLRGLDEASVTRATSWGLRKLGLAAYADRWTVAVVPILFSEDIRAGNEPLCHIILVFIRFGK